MIVAELLADPGLDLLELGGFDSVAPTSAVAETLATDFEADFVDTAITEVVAALVTT